MSRIAAIVIDLDVGPLLIANVYMPTNYGDMDSLELYVDCLSKLHALIIDTNCAHVVIAGDFNCSSGSRFFDEFVNFASENKLVMSDMSRLSSAITYVSDDCTKLTWIDHVSSSVDMDNLIADICILDDVIVSDHRPISFCLQCSVLHGPVRTVQSSNTTHIVAEWSSYTNTLNYYAAYLDNFIA